MWLPRCHTEGWRTATATETPFFSVVTWQEGIRMVAISQWMSRCARVQGSRNCRTHAGKGTATAQALCARGCVCIFYAPDLGPVVEQAPEPETKDPAPAQPMAASPKNIDYNYLPWLKTPHTRRWMSLQRRHVNQHRVTCLVTDVLFWAPWQC